MKKKAVTITVGEPLRLLIQLTIGEPQWNLIEDHNIPQIPDSIQKERKRAADKRMSDGGSKGFLPGQKPLDANLVFESVPRVGVTTLIQDMLSNGFSINQFFWRDADNPSRKVIEVEILPTADVETPVDPSNVSELFNLRGAYLYLFDNRGVEEDEGPSTTISVVLNHGKTLTPEVELGILPYDEEIDEEGNFRVGLIGSKGNS